MGKGRTNGADWANQPAPPNASITYKIGIYGWRKRLIYLFILILMVMIVINLALTIWILRVMDFSIDGMGKLRIVDKGIRVEGETEFLSSIHATKISSRQDVPLSLESYKNVTIHARDGTGSITDRMIIGDHRVEAFTQNFIVNDRRGNVLFSVSGDDVKIGAHKITITGPEGVTFEGSIQTPVVRADAKQNLRLESPTRSVKITAPEGLDMMSSIGKIDIKSLSDLKLESKNKAIHLDAKDIFMKNIKISRPASLGQFYPGVYQLCVCKEGGRLFLSNPSGECRAGSDTC